MRHEESRLNRRVARVECYLHKKYDRKELSKHQACKELCFRGRELGSVLDTSKLSSLRVRDVALYIVLHT